MCTSFQLRADDGSVCVGRTMEFPDMLGANLTVIPRDVTLTSEAPDGDGATWTSVHGVVGMDAVGRPQWLTDGMNEAGLYAGALYMPGFASYPPPSPDAGSNLSVLDAVTFALTQAATVAEAFALLATRTIWGPVNPLLGAVPPLHVVLHDASGDAGVVEFVDGAAVAHPNPLGVATNAPYLEWHYDNVRNWLPRLGPANPAPVDIRGVTFAPLAQGQGFVGLPGDSGSTGRFLRATAYVSTVHAGASAADAEQTCLHVLNNFDIPAGLMTGVGPNGQEQDDQTKWSSISSLSARRYIVRLQANPAPFAVDLRATDFTTSSPRQVALAPGGFTELQV
ncbi:linear amide C-N hydrolase [Microbacterium sp.]|uniref:linear amide C-N hydrolase n=1 Tax=Microbacterium sp. TaxID=51671 RepID=UPI003F6E59FC